MKKISNQKKAPPNPSCIHKNTQLDYTNRFLVISISKDDLDLKELENICCSSNVFEIVNTCF